MKTSILCLLLLSTFNAQALITDIQVQGAYQWSLTHYGAKGEVGALNVVESPLSAEKTQAVVIKIKQLAFTGGTVHVINPQEHGPLIPSNIPVTDLAGVKSEVGQITIPWVSVCDGPDCQAKTTSLTLWVDNNPALAAGGLLYRTAPVQDDQLTITVQTN